VRTVAAISVCIAFSFAYVRLASAQAETQSEPAANAQSSAASGDEIHFVSVLTMNGEVVAIDPASLLVTVKANGAPRTLEVASDKQLENLKPGDHAVIRYFEGGQIAKATSPGAASVSTLNDGLVEASNHKHRLGAVVERVDPLNQEIEIKGSDGSLETIEVTNPAQLARIKVGDQIVITHAEAAALSVEKQS
jgi:hypothetical protein